MKTLRHFLLLAALVLCGWSSSLRAEDIDIYVDSAVTGTGLPNVLFIFDNAASFNSTASHSCTYADGGSPSLGNTAGGVEQCTLYNAIYGLQEGSINIGLMVFNHNNVNPAPGSGTCPGGVGGCLVKPLTMMTGTHKTDFLSWIKTWGTTYNIEGSAISTGAVMQEAWAYYAGQVGASGRLYSGVQPSAGCQNNYVIYVGNAFRNNTTPGENGNVSPSGLLNAAVPAASTAQKAQINIPSGSYGSKSFSCAKGNPFSMPNNHNDSSGLWADEWARYMYESDLYSGFDGVQNITTYTIGFLGPQCDASYPALLTSMANVGGGKYFAAEDYNEFKTALETILNEVQAVNSVFSSASLPVSVNAQGTYENQIFLGMFRPDASAAPRWVGNLKQYQFILEHLDPSKPDPNTATLKLGDQNGNAAISSAGTGFITPGAVSFWTKKDTSAAPDSTGGFFVNDSKGVGGAFDSADGEYVDKGGAAQIARLKSLIANHSTTAGTSTNPRTVYTYCPSGTGCQSSLGNASNLFATSNADITAAKLSATVPLSVSGITRSDTVATVNSTAHGLAVGDSVTISGANQSEYNGDKTVTSVTANSFTFTVSVSPPSPATGSYSASVPSAPKAVSSMSRSGNTVTVTVPAHGYTTGQVVTIAGATPGDYNKTTSITVVNASTFTYTVAETPPTSAGNGTATVGVSNVKTIAVSGVTRTAGSLRTRITTTTAHGFPNGGIVNLSGILDANGVPINEYTGSFVIKAIQSTGNPRVWFEIDIAATGPAQPTGSITVDAGTVPVPVALIRSGTTATATSVGAHGFTAGQTVSIGGTVGTNEQAYAGTVTVTAVGGGGTTFNYTVATSPATPATGSLSASKAGISDRVALINWVRGENNYGDEASPGSPYTVRPSIHGDVLHSRPLVINYGDDRGTVVFYGANDGLFRAINGSQTSSIGSVPAGGELWGLVLPEHYTQLSRQRLNTPELRFPTTLLAAAKRKDYFVDGPTGAYQKYKNVPLDPLDASNTATKSVIDEAVIFLTMRRGGRLLYALDVTQPASPTVLWRVSNSTSGFGELGQTWSRPRVTLTNAQVSGSDVGPVVIFGGGYAGGYDASGNAMEEDAEPPTANTMGRAIYVLNAKTGERIWSAQQNCGAIANCLSVPGMLWSIPSDIAFLDRNNDGKIDRLYAPDMGGNVWRVDINSVNVADWSVTKIAALGCATGTCTAGTTPRKFFFPPAVVSVGATGAAGSYDMVMLGSGDREHPLLNTSNLQSAHNVTNRFYMIKDTATGMSATAIAASSPALPITEAVLDNGSNVAYVKDTTDGGFYITFTSGEKTVNAPVTVFGTTYLGTNKPSTPSGNTCSSNLGEARGYAINPFTAAYSSAIYDGGGLPPSPTAGFVTMQVGDQTLTKQFCIGCGGGSPVEGGGGGGSQSACVSALENCANPLAVPRSPRRTYWYRN